MRSPLVATTPRPIRSATLRDLAWCYHLQNDLHDHVGYCPRGGLEDRIRTGRILIVEENQEPAGYVSVTHRRDHTTHLTQLAIDPQLWRTRLGSLLWHRITTTAIAAGSIAVTLKCATDLPANAFWHSTGAHVVGIRTDRRRPLLCWTYPLVEGVRVLPQPPFPQLRKGRS